MPVPLASLEGQRFGKMSPSLCPQHPHVTPGMSGAAALRLPHPTSKLSLYFRDRDQHASTHPSGDLHNSPWVACCPLAFEHGGFTLALLLLLPKEPVARRGAGHQHPKSLGQVGGRTVTERGLSKTIAFIPPPGEAALGGSFLAFCREIEVKF